MDCRHAAAPNVGILLEIRNAACDSLRPNLDVGIDDRQPATRRVLAGLIGCGCETEVLIVRDDLEIREHLGQPSAQPSSDALSTIVMRISSIPSLLRRHSMQQGATAIELYVTMTA